MIKELIELGKKENIDIQVFKALSKDLGIDILNNKITNYNNSNIISYQIKGIINHECASLITENIDDPKAIINDLKSIINLKDNKNDNRLATESISNRLIADKINLDNIKKDMLSLYEMHNIDDRLKDFQLSFNYSFSEYEITNDLVNMLDQKQIYSFDGAITASNDDNNKIIYFHLYTDKYDFISFKELMKKKIEELLFKLDSISIKTNKYNVILNNEVMTNILESFIPMFNSKAIYFKESLLDGLHQQKVFSSKLNIIEDPTNSKYIGKRLFDSEGTLTSKKYLIRNGIFENKINNIEYALKLKELPTGNSYGVRNLYIEPDNNTFTTLIKSMNNGIIINNVMGTHSGINSKNGNISLQAEGLLVENGKVIKSLSTIILTTNIKELLNNIELIGSDLVFFDSKCGSPSILFKDITISGKEVN